MENEMLNRYSKEMNNMIKLIYPKCDTNIIQEAIEYSIQKRLKNRECTLSNNYTHKETTTSMLEITDVILRARPVMTSFGVLFKRHTKNKDILYDFIEALIVLRNKFKKKMFTYPKGTELFGRYNQLQTLKKMDCNSIYGILGMPKSILFNIYIAASITFQGKACISEAITFFESLLADNCKWGSIDEIINFIHEVVYIDKRKYNLLGYVEDRTEEEVFLKIMKNCGFNGYFPSIRNCNVVFTILNRLTQDELNRLYYRNNIFDFCDSDLIQSRIKLILESLDKPFQDPNNPPENIVPILDEIYEYIKDYVYHPHLHISRLDRIQMMKRSVSIVTDTDSSFISFDAWYRYVLQFTAHKHYRFEDYKSKLFTRIKRDEFGVAEKEFLRKLYTIEEKEKDYNFFTGEITYKEESDFIPEIPERKYLRHSIINIMAYICSKLLNDHMTKLADAYNGLNEHQPCIIQMKNETLMKKLLLVAKKNYCCKEELQEGNLIPDTMKASMKVTGMMIKKEDLPLLIRKQLQKILYDEVLNKNGEINPLEIVKKLCIVEKGIVDNLKSGKKDFYKPVRVKSFSSYKSPMGIQGIKASVVYNYMKDELENEINLKEQNSLDIVDLLLNTDNVEKIKDKYPEKYAKLVELMKTDDFDGNIDYIAIPLDARVPEWVLEFIDYNKIVNKNLKNFPLNEIGISNHNNDLVNYTNVIQI